MTNTLQAHFYIPRKVYQTRQQDCRGGEKRDGAWEGEEEGVDA
jgi:hypothetical protein